MIKRAIEVGDTVAFNRLPDATWFDVLAINGFTLTIREHGTEYTEQRIDASYVKQYKRGKFHHRHL